MSIIDSKDIQTIERFPREKNVIVGSIPESDLDLFFGPLENDDIFVVFPADTKFPDVAVAFGIFSSKSQARKNGWGGDIPNGFWDKERIGKLNHRITILKIIGDSEE
jgi:hypothetical protein